MSRSELTWLLTVTHLVEVEQYSVLPEVADIAAKLRENLPTAAKDLLAFCQGAAHRYGKVRHPRLQHPIPTIGYANQVLSSESQNSTDDFVIQFAHDFIATKGLFAADSEEDRDPRLRWEDDIADLEAEKALLLQQCVS